MNDTELADRLVALRIISHYNNTGTAHEHEWPETIVRDWRVAGALMEKAAKKKRTVALSFGCEMFCATDAESSTPTYGVYLERSNESAPRAIIEAAVEALERVLGRRTP